MLSLPKAWQLCYHSRIVRKMFAIKPLLQIMIPTGLPSGSGAGQLRKKCIIFKKSVMPRCSSRDCPFIICKDRNKIFQRSKNPNPGKIAQWECMLSHITLLSVFRDNAMCIRRVPNPQDNCTKIHSFKNSNT